MRGGYSKSFIIAREGGGGRVLLKIAKGDRSDSLQY